MCKFDKNSGVNVQNQLIQFSLLERYDIPYITDPTNLLTLFWLYLCSCGNIENWKNYKEVGFNYGFYMQSKIAEKFFCAFNIKLVAKVSNRS